MSVCVVTGSGGLVGSEAALRFAGHGMDVVGVDNDMRARFFGADASTAAQVSALKRELHSSYRHHALDVRDTAPIIDLFRSLGRAVTLVIHAAAQPSHDWAAREPITDFDINARGTLNLLEATRLHCPDAVFIFLSTNKVYGDRPNELPFDELATRWEIVTGHTYTAGIREDMSVDTCLHSLFGASKLAADVLVQEYGRYFGLKTVCFRAGTITGGRHAATELHGFLAYLMHCAMTGQSYRVIGYKGKQVRDAIHAYDLVKAFECVYASPRAAEVYNIGGGRVSNVSVVEALTMASHLVGQEVERSYHPRNRVGDHIWWVSDNSRFSAHYPGWELTYDIGAILNEIHATNQQRWRR